MMDFTMIYLENEVDLLCRLLIIKKINNKMTYDS